MIHVSIYLNINSIKTLIQGLKKLRELTTIYVQLEKKDSKTQKKKTTMSNHERFLRALRHEKIPSASQMRSGRQNKEALVSRIQQDMKKGLKQQWPECLRCCKSKNVRCFCRTSKCANFLAHGEIGKKCDSCSN